MEAKILLRPFLRSDAEAVHAMLADGTVGRFLGSRIPTPYTRKDARWWVTTGCHEGFNWAVEVDRTLVGSIGAEADTGDRAHSAQEGYWIGERHWGKGIASRALRAARDRLLAERGLWRQHAFVFHPNHASMRVLQKADFVAEGIERAAVCVRGKVFDAHRYGWVAPGHGVEHSE